MSLLEQIDVTFHFVHELGTTGWLKINTRRWVHWYFFVALCKLHVLSDVFEYTSGVMGEEMMQSGSPMIQFLCIMEKVEE